MGRGNSALIMTKIKSSTYDHSISFVKGIAILGAIFIHLLDWSNYVTTDWLLQFKELLYPVIFIFVACSGSLAYISFKRRSYKLSSQRVLVRGIQLIGIYYLYNLVKLFFYDFKVEDFYLKFQDAGTLDAWGILTLQSFTAPVSIIFTIGTFLLLTPVIMRLLGSKKLQWTFPLLIGGLLLLNYSGLYPHNAVFDFLLARNNIMFPLLLWLPVYLIGMYLAHVGFNKAAFMKLLFFLLATILYAISFIDLSKVWLPREFAYPMSIYYMLFSLTATYLLVNFFNLIRNISERITEPIEMLGESTFSLFIWHLVIIDLTRLFYPQNPMIVWTTVSLYVLLFIAYKYIKRYNASVS